jgi:hypothetical protein
MVEHTSAIARSSTIEPESAGRALEARIAGATLGEVADLLDLMPEGARKALLREARPSGRRHP